jgi:prevent-host-death family protein
MVDVGDNSDVADVLVHGAERAVNLKKSANLPFARTEGKGEPAMAGFPADLARKNGRGPSFAGSFSGDPRVGCWGDTVTLDGWYFGLHSYTMPSSITIKELHATTGEHVRRAGASKTPVVITDRGRPVAVLASASLLAPRKRKRTLLPEYEAMMARSAGNDIQSALDEIRGER